jgi:hypothetical protein
MSNYIVHFVTGASTSVRVEADNPDDAIKKAANEVNVSICHQCADEFDLGDEWEPEVVTNEDGVAAWEHSPT